MIFFAECRRQNYDRVIISEECSVSRRDLWELGFLASSWHELSFEMMVLLIRRIEDLNQSS
jgi:hypothetical protein